MTAAIAATNIETRLLKPIKATADSLQGYGYLIGAPAGVSRDKIDFYGDDVKVTQPAKFHGNADLCLNLVSFQPRPLQVKWMEFHTKHTQTFIPLSGKPFYMVLGKPTCRRADGSWDALKPQAPDPATVEAFAFDGSGGLVMEVGTWHEVPFPIDGTTHFVCICTNETNDNLEAQKADGECDGDDLTKRNLVKRFGYTFEIEPEPQTPQSLRHPCGDGAVLIRKGYSENFELRRVGMAGDRPDQLVMLPRA